MNKMLANLALISILATSTMTYAGNTHDPLVNARQHVQKHRIIDGVKSGELTKRETKTLVRQQKRINKLEWAYKSDGHLTRAERKNLARAQNRASKSIYKKKHNRRAR